MDELFDLASARRRAHLSQQELANASGVSLRTIKNIERGGVRTPQPHTLRRILEALEANAPAPQMTSMSGGPCCSFCGKQRDQVERLIPGPRLVFICAECVELCVDIIQEGRVSTERPAPKAEQQGLLRRLWRTLQTLTHTFQPAAFPI